MRRAIGVGEVFNVYNGLQSEGLSARKAMIARSQRGDSLAFYHLAMARPPIPLSSSWWDLRSTWRRGCGGEREVTRPV